MSSPARQNETIEKLEALLSGIHIAMMTTRAADGSLHTRPMASQATPKLDQLWFFTSDDSAKATEINAAQEVSLSYADPKRQCYVGISGVARIIRDEAKARELWNAWVQVWFPKGPSDPAVRLVQVIPHRAEYWDGSSTRFAMIYEAAKAALGGTPERPKGDHGQIDLPPK